MVRSLLLFCAASAIVPVAIFLSTASVAGAVMVTKLYDSASCSSLPDIVMLDWIKKCRPLPCHDYEYSENTYSSTECVEDVFPADWQVPGGIVVISHEDIDCTTPATHMLWHSPNLCMQAKGELAYRYTCFKHIPTRMFYKDCDFTKEPLSMENMSEECSMGSIVRCAE